LACLSIVGIVRIFSIIDRYNFVCMLILLYWLIVNLYTILMVILLINGRKRNNKYDKYGYGHSTVVVNTNEIVKLKRINGNKMYAITSSLTEHIIKISLNNNNFLRIGDSVEATIKTDKYKIVVNCIVTDIRYIYITGKYQIILEIHEYENEGEYLQILYDRIPTLPQSIKRDTYLTLILRNIFYRVMGIFSHFSVEKPKPVDDKINLKIVIE